MKRIAMLAMLAVGCVRTTVQPVGTGPSGEQRLYLTCNQNIGRCYERAAAECPSGYSVVDSGGVTQQVVIGGAQTTCRDGLGNTISCTTTPPPTVPVFSGALVVDCREWHPMPAPKTEQAASVGRPCKPGYCR